jgi:histidinol-phosphate aminotransferase
LSEAILARAAPGVARLAPYVPGRPISELARELGHADIVKLASNENPLGPAPKALAAVRAALAELALYPDGSGHALKTALAAHHGLSREHITLGNGSNDVLVLLAEAFLTPGDEAVYSEYAFAVYPIAVQAAGATARVARARPNSGAQPLGHDLAALAGEVGPRTKLVFLANPNNPTGTWLEEEPLRAFIAALPPSCVLVLDEAYTEYAREHGVPDGTRWLRDFPNLVVVRTFSKAYGLAGLRVGYALSAPDIAGLLNRVRQPFNVNSLALAAATAALADDEHLHRTLALNRAGLRQLCAGLKALGILAPPSAGNFVLAGLKGPAAPIAQALEREGVIVRPVGNYGLPGHLRITTGTELENARLLTTLARCLPGGKP